MYNIYKYVFVYACVCIHFSSLWLHFFYIDFDDQKFYKRMKCNSSTFLFIIRGFYVLSKGSLPTPWVARYSSVFSSGCFMVLSIFYI